MQDKSKRFLVDTRPSKAVVVDSLTRDITVEACIFDLIDNSIDAARKTIYAINATKIRKDELTISYTGFEINLTLNGTGCIIDDNCGGISVENLKKMVLRFGERSSQQLGIGVFGVGLNRALFKLGRVSHLKTDTGTQRAELILNTSDYLKSKSWDLPAEEFESNGRAETRIEIRQPPEDISRIFSDNDRNESLLHTIGRRYGRFISKGLAIQLNDKPASNEEVQLREDGPYAGMQKSYTTEDNVFINLQFGQHKFHRFSAEPDHNLKQNKSLTKQYGWTILCNDRAIVISDRTPKTGWYANFHNEFYGFVGFVEFVSSDPAKLPWDTTKTDVNVNNNAYQSVLGEMKHFAEKWRVYARDAKFKKRNNEVLLPIPSKSSAISEVPAQKNSAETNSNKNGKTKQPTPAKQTTKDDHNRYRTILPSDIDEKNCNDKHLALVHEAKQLDLALFNYAGLELIRTLFEITVITYLERHKKFGEFKQFAADRRRNKGVTIEDVKKITPNFEEMISYLENNPDIWGAAKANHLKHSLKRMAAHKQTLNSAVHNAFELIHRSQAFQIRDEVLPILRHLIEN